MNSHDLCTQKKCTFWLHFGSIWDPHVPKTLLFTMNFNDFRGVVFEVPNEPKQSLRLRKLGQVGAVLVQIVHPSRHPFAQVIVKTLSISNLQETKVSLSAIYIYFVFTLLYFYLGFFNIYFFRVQALPESRSCVGVVTISRKGPKHAD